MLDPGKILGVVQLVTGGTVLLVTYAAMALALRVPEVRQFAGLIKGKLGR